MAYVVFGWFSGDFLCRHGHFFSTENSKVRKAKALGTDSRILAGCWDILGYSPFGLVTLTGRGQGPSGFIFFSVFFTPKSWGNDPF